MKNLFVLLLLAALGCAQEDPTGNNPSQQNSLVKNQNRYENTATAMQSNDLDGSDAFELKKAWLNEWNLYIIVSYSGGCKTHEFELIWPEVITMIYPPSFDTYLLHNSNDDMCEAYLTDTLVFDLSENNLILDIETLQATDLGIVNGSDPNEVVYPNH